MYLQKKLKHCRRKIYGLRAYVPGLRRKHKLEALVGPLGFWKQLQRYQFDVVSGLGLRPEHCLLDIGCGPLQGGIRFISYLQPGGYVGVDQNPAVIEIAQEEVSRHKLWDKKPRLILSHDFGDDQLDSADVDFIWMSQILYYFDEKKIHKLCAMIRRRLRPGGIMAGDILGPASDRSFLRDPKSSVHTAESLHTIARCHGLQVQELGYLGDFGYPRRLGLRHNVLLKISHAESRT